MKKYGGVPVWIILTATLLALGFSIWALAIAYSSFKGEYVLVFDPSVATEITSLVITVIGVLITVYFVIVGINVSRIDKEISEKKLQIEKDLKEIECDNLDVLYGQLVRLTETVNNVKKRRSILDSINLSRARLATQGRFLTRDKRLQRMTALDMLGGLTDIIDLDKIINDPTEDVEIIESAKMRKEAIEIQLGIRQS